MTTLIAPVTHSAFPAVRGRRFVLVRDGLWRIVDPVGAVVGYIEREASADKGGADISGADGDRYSARRVVFATRTRELGVFCRIDDAVDCFR
ncbi:DNA mismatch repair protein [Cryobacterium sp. TMT1-2-2]|uniref:DNA mismatch repair protein n=1 Tax=Cryobacterium sp. TMT1-2-2 TaxID=1259233 RepID=UPI00106DB613|nr:DNA mismatch repair protein [Cryobacterium sp. TMT1-2-2]TFD14854.1 DNA mismatch repair protein [Cryobacterium sp. TMT1-2-2]